MPVRLHEIISFWIYADSWSIEDDRIKIEATDKPNAGPTDAVFLELPAEGYVVNTLHLSSDTDHPYCLLLKPITLGGSYLVFGAVPTLRSFAEHFATD